MWQALIWPQGYHFNKLGTGPLGGSHVQLHQEPVINHLFLHRNMLQEAVSGKNQIMRFTCCLNMAFT